MGDKISTANSSITDKIQLVNNTQHSLFGKIDIYHMTEPPYQYLMDFKKNYINDKQRMNKDLALMNQLKNIQHGNLAKIYHSEVKEDAQLCIKHQMLHSYVNYYNFTLKQAIQKKKLTKYHFSQGDLLYITKSLVGFATQLKKYGISKAIYRSEEIFLSPQGHIKLYLLNIDHQNKHSCYYTVLSQKQKLSQYLLAPQQLNNIQKLQIQTNFDQFKADLFAIGLVIVELITLDHAKFYYNYEKLQFRWQKIQFLLDSFASNKYSQQFIKIVKRMLEPDPNNRLSLQQANQMLKQHSQRQTQRLIYCIRLQADQNPNIPKSQDQPPKRKMMLNNLTSKLQPKPISMLSSTSTKYTTMNTSLKKTTEQ